MKSKDEIILAFFDMVGWLWWFIKKPFIWFGKQNWKLKIIIVVLILTIFDKLRFWLFDFLMWLLI